MLENEFKRIKEEWLSKITLKIGEPAGELFLRQLAVLEAEVEEKISKLQKNIDSLKDENNIVRGLIGANEVEIKSKLLEKSAEVSYLHNQLLELKKKIDDSTTELEKKLILIEKLKSEKLSAEKEYNDAKEKMNTALEKLELRLKEVDSAWSEKNKSLSLELSDQRRFYHNKLTIASVEIWKFSYGVFSEWIKYIRDQLGVIFGAADYMHENITSSKAGSLKKIRTSIEPDLRLIREKISSVVLSFNRMAEFFSAQPELAPLDVNFLLKKIKEPYIKSALNFKWPQELDYPKIVVDEKLLAEAFDEVLKNAVDSAQKNERTAEIIVSAEFDEINIIFDISDNGPGIPAENLEKLFAPFFTTKPHKEGLGLVKAKRNIIFHSGEIFYTLKNNLPTFRIKLNALSRK